MERCKVGKMVFVVWVLGLAALAPAADLEWDTAPAAGPQPGSGTWDFVTPFWWNGSANVTWTDLDNADFGAGLAPYTVTLADDVVVDVLFCDPNAVIDFVGPYEIGLGGTALGDGYFIAQKCDGVTVDCGFSNTGAGSDMDPEIRVGGRDRELVINGDINVSDVHEGTDDLVLRRHGTGSGYAYITLNGDYTHSVVDTPGALYICGWNGDSGTRTLSKIWVTINGTVDYKATTKPFGIQTGAVVEIGGRVEASYIRFQPQTSVTGYETNIPVVQGTEDQQGVLAIALADYNRRFIRGTSSFGGDFYASNLNLEIDCVGWDPNDTSTDVYKLMDNTNTTGWGRWYGNFASVSMVNAPAGMILTFRNMPETPEDDTPKDIYMIFETADIDESGCVGYGDIAAMGLQWGRTDCKDDDVDDNCSGCDLNHSGAVDPNDLQLLGREWLDGCGS